MASFVIVGGHKLHGEIHPQGAKNEVLQILCATLLTSEEVVCPTTISVPGIEKKSIILKKVKERKIGKKWKNDFF